MRRPAWQLTALALLFVGPFVVAILLYATRGAVGGIEQLSNPDRELIAAPVQVPLAALRLADGSASEAAWARSRWSLVYARMRPCETECMDALARLHQVWLALGGERDRVQQVLLAPAGGSQVPVPEGMLSALIDAPDGPDLVPLLGAEHLEAGRLFVIDPLGNIILTYPDDADQARLLRDLERLLDVSRVG